MRFLIGLMWLLHWLPLPLLGRLGEGVGMLLFHVMGPRRHITLTNLRLCLPQLSDDERRRMAKRHFQAYARSILERGILWWGSEARLKRLIRMEPGLPLQEMAAKPTILLCPHFVCLDVAGARIAMEISASSMYSQQQNAVFDVALRRGRSRFKPVKLFTRGDGIKPIIRALRDGLPFFMLPDMDFGTRDAEFVPFFGIAASTLTAPARIAAVTGAQVIPVIATYLPDYAGWKVRFYPAWTDFPGDDVTAATRRVNAFIEERILEAPDEYLWTHKRFKTRPPGEPSVYDR
ncbi:KDO2-lipid IV(A) lauroyltransferase [Noviherbaspirillum humi]|uniref:KDO2-lipid IV(A) lauroyltransferase n=1 Tax=Noviherbaspirillum humi TaxID=1688639 RepID=A0A239CH00_9BURK|nr:lipid A biosynthesis acyltransferase [Noviherbaspirillum humi]SNS18764.1 KDO2-lipid IV(A) lauroyltransferase [Noviherbaspirillum humi]